MKKNLEFAIVVSTVMSIMQVFVCVFISKIPQSEPNVIAFWVMSAIVSITNIVAIINAFTYSPKEKKARFLLIIFLPVLGILAGANLVLVIGIFAFATAIVMLSFFIWDHDFVNQ